MRSFASCARLGAAPIALALSACSPAATSLGPDPQAPVVEYVSRQEILTPLPLRVQLPSRYGAERVFVIFHTWGSRKWSTLELAREGQTWEGAVSCREVSTVSGDTRYFFLALDPEGEVVAGSGSPEWPHVATIVHTLPDGPQSLPGARPPARCHDPADCPPDFPGCPAYTFRRPKCATDDDCASGQSCAWDHYCGAASIADEVDPDADPNASEEEQLEAAVRRVTKRYGKANARARSSARVH